MTARSGLFVAPLPGTPPVGTAPTDGRLVLGGVFGTTPQLVAGGAITQSGTTMQFTMAAAVWMLPDPTNAAAVFLSATDQVVLTPAAGPGTGSRVDSFIVKQNNYENADADSRVNATNLAGTAGTPGVPPTLPSAAYFRYANITVPALASTASACTVSVLTPTTFAPVDIQSPTLALLNLVTGATGQQATVTADTNNNGQYIWRGSWVLAVGDTGWITPTLGNSWVGVAGLIPQYRRLNGVVYLRGRAQSGTTATAFTLPAGFRPSYSSVFAVLEAATTSTVDRVVVNTDGTVTLVAGQIPNFPQITFPADA